LPRGFPEKVSNEVACSLALEELVIHELLPEVPVNAAPSNSSIVNRGKNAKQIKKSFQH
jgi:hypothetical protein